MEPPAYTNGHTCFGMKRRFLLVSSVVRVLCSCRPAERWHEYDFVPRSSHEIVVRRLRPTELVLVRESFQHTTKTMVHYLCVAVVVAPNL